MMGDNFDNLIGLDLSKNDLTGQIPDSLGSMENLEYLLLNGNDLSGEIPASLGQLSNLSDLYLQNNFLLGAFPDISGAPVDGDLRIQNNCLESDDQEIIDWVAAHADPGEGLDNQQDFEVCFAVYDLIFEDDFE